MTNATFPPRQFPIPQELTSNDLSSLITANPQLTNVTCKNPLKRGFNPKYVTPSTSHHIASAASMLSMSNVNQADYSGFFNLGILVFIAITSRLIIENLMKYGLLFNLGMFWSSSDTESTLFDTLVALSPFFFFVFFIVVWSPLLAYVIEAFATGKRLFQPAFQYQIPNQTSIASNNSTKDIEKNALLSPKIATYLHVANILALFFTPLIYIWTTTRLNLLLRFPIAFMTVVTTLKLFSYVHVSCNIRSTSGQVVVLDTSLHNNRTDSEKKNENKSPSPLSSINLSTAVVFPLQSKQLVQQLQQEVLTSMQLGYFTQLKLLLHTVTMRYISFRPDELTTNIDANTAKTNRTAHASFLSSLISIIFSPFALIYRIFFGSDKQHLTYSIITRGFNVVRTSHTFNYSVSYIGEDSTPGFAPAPEPSNNRGLSTPNNLSSPFDSYDLFSQNDSNEVFSELFDMDNKTSMLSNLNAGGMAQQRQICLNIENRFNQNQTNMLQLSLPNFSMGQTPENDPSCPKVEKPTPILTTSKSKQDKSAPVDKGEPNCSSPIRPISVLYSKNCTALTKTNVHISNLPQYPQASPRYTILQYAPCFTQLVYFLISPTLNYQISYPRNSRIKFHFLLRRILEIISIAVILLFFIEQFVKPTLHNSLRYFLSLDKANSQLREQVVHKLQAGLQQVPEYMNATFSVIEQHVNSTLSKIINEQVTTRFLEQTNSIANSLVDVAEHSFSPLDDSMPAQSLSGPIYVLLSAVLGILERILKLALPNVIIWLLIFYGLFHSYLNLVAEIAQFGDREFYLEWYNSKTLQEYWNTWNQPVYSFFARHLFSILVSFKVGNTASKFAIFLVSAFLHEVLISIPMQIVSFHAFFGMLFQVPLILLTNFLYKKHKNAAIGNVIFWVSFVILGQPSLILMYFYQYLSTHGLITDVVPG